MRGRRLAVATIGLLAVLPSAAHAGKTVCNQIRDFEGDGGARFGGGPPLNSPPTDIVAADIATGAKTVVAIIKIASLETDPEAAAGVRYDFFFVVKGITYRFTADRDVQGTVTYEFSAGAVTGSLNPDTRTFKFVTARSNVKGLSTKGQKLTELRSSTYVDHVSSADSAKADPKYAYTDRTASCLKPA